MKQVTAYIAAIVLSTSALSQQGMSLAGTTYGIFDLGGNPHGQIEIDLDAETWTVPGTSITGTTEDTNIGFDFEYQGVNFAVASIEQDGTIEVLFDAWALPGGWPLDYTLVPLTMAGGPNNNPFVQASRRANAPSDQGPVVNEAVGSREDPVLSCRW